MDWLAIALATAAGVLVAGGAAKVVAPHAAAVMLHRIGLPASLLAGRLLGGAELGLGALALTITARGVATTVGIAYLGLAAMVVLLVRQGATEQCGCFGAAGGPPRLGHAVANFVLAVGSLVAAARGTASLYDTVTADPLRGLVVAPVVAALVLMIVTAFGRSRD